MSVQAGLPIPAPDPIPVPAPVGFLHALLLATFLLHLLAMNGLLGGAWIAVVASVRGRRTNGELSARLYRDLAGLLPALVAATVTLGVAPLLFVQVLFGHLVYTSSIAIGWFWWGVVPVLVVAYALLYRQKFRAEGGERLPRALPWIPAALLLWISFVFSDQFHLAAQPERFAGRILEDAGGLWLNVGDASGWPRWLHMAIGATAVSGVFVMWIGRWRLSRDGTYGRFCLAHGYRWFRDATMANVFVGFVFLMTLPERVGLRLMGREPFETALWMIGFALALAAIGLFKKATARPEGRALLAGTASLAGTLVAMVLLRDRVRSAYLEPFFEVSSLETEVAWGPIAMFLVSFAVALVVLAWLLSAWRAGRGTAPAGLPLHPS